MSKRKIYCVGRCGDYGNWMGGKLVDRMEEADLVLFTGGEDVDSSLYKEPSHPQSGSFLPRDEAEQQEYNRARSLGKKMIGICRGSQFLCVMAGGRLVQHQGNPAYKHNITVNVGEGERTVVTTSSHHQAQFPFEMSKQHYAILGWTQNHCGFHQDGRQQEMNPPKECEIVWYPTINALAVQGHPEWMLDHPDIKFYQELLNRFMQDTL
jgi:gamma-glutamyl-gamma-aminobutyrate hydrolase PuuD